MFKMGQMVCLKSSVAHVTEWSVKVVTGILVYAGLEDKQETNQQDRKDEDENQTNDTS